MRRLYGKWKTMRKEISKLPIRDCVDNLEFDMDSYSRLKRIRLSLLDGTYHPQQPDRTERAKSNGAFRVMTWPQIEDAIVFRTITDFIYYNCCKRSEPPSSFFSRTQGRMPIGRKVDEISNDDYLSFLEIWLRYKDYREKLGLSGLYKYIVVADISNYFDSIQHNLLLEYLAPYGIPREALGVLGKLLEVLRPQAEYSSTPAVGLPIDSVDCSRTLAHVFLFEHDRRIIRAPEVLKDAYIRWMDDQNIGVKSKVAGRKVIRHIVQSLGTQRLTINSGKTKILKSNDLVSYFCLDENRKADSLEKEISENTSSKAVLEDKFADIWNAVKNTERLGHVDKVIKRLYRLAGMIKSDLIILDDCKLHLVELPEMAPRIFEYLIARGRYDEHIKIFEWFIASGNSIYENVEVEWFESVLVASPPQKLQSAYRNLAIRFIRGKVGTQKPAPKVSAALLLYWLWDGRQGRVIETMLKSTARMSGSARRTMAAILCARKPRQANQWLLLASKQASPQVSSLIEWVHQLIEGKKINISKPLIFVKKPSLIGKWIYDARAWLRLELLSMSSRSEIKDAVVNAIDWLESKNAPQPIERRIAKRIRTRLLER